MKCPICGKEMQDGGIVVDGVAPMWVPKEQFDRKGLKRIIYREGRSIGKTNIILGQTKISGAFFCRECNKVIGIFDVTNNID